MIDRTGSKPVEMFVQVLRETKTGICLANPHGYLIYSDQKDIIIKSRLFKGCAGKIFYLIENGICYGLIRLRAPDKITVDEFHTMTPLHLITDTERRKWWARKEVLYAYGFDRVKMFDPPRQVSVNHATDAFVDDFKFLGPAVKSLPPQTIKDNLFYPMEPAKQFCQVDEILKHMTSNKHAIEKVYGGTRVILHKSGNTVSIYSDKNNVTVEYPGLVTGAGRVSNKDFVLDAELIHEPGCPTILYVSDIVELGAEDLTSLPWHARKSILHSLSFQPNIREAYSIVADCLDEAGKALNLLGNLDGSMGVMVKAYNSKYTKNDKTDDWLKLVIENALGPTVSGTPGISEISGKTWKKKKISGPKKLGETNE